MGNHTINAKIKSFFNNIKLLKSIYDKMISLTGKLSNEYNSTSINDKISSIYQEIDNISNQISQSDDYVNSRDNLNNAKLGYDSQYSDFIDQLNDYNTNITSLIDTLQDMYENFQNTVNSGNVSNHYYDGILTTDIMPLSQDRLDYEQESLLFREAGPAMHNEWTMIHSGYGSDAVSINATFSADEIDGSHLLHTIGDADAARVYGSHGLLEILMYSVNGLSLAKLDLANNEIYEVMNDGIEWSISIADDGTSESLKRNVIIDIKSGDVVYVRSVNMNLYVSNAYTTNLEKHITGTSIKRSKFTGIDQNNTNVVVENDGFKSVISNNKLSNSDSLINISYTPAIKKFIGSMNFNKIHVAKDKDNYLNYVGWKNGRIYLSIRGGKWIDVLSKLGERNDIAIDKFLKTDYDVIVSDVPETRMMIVLSSKTDDSISESGISFIVISHPLHSSDNNIAIHIDTDYHQYDKFIIFSDEVFRYNHVSDHARLTAVYKLYRTVLFPDNPSEYTDLIFMVDDNGFLYAINKYTSNYIASFSPDDKSQFTHSTYNTNQSNINGEVKTLSGDRILTCDGRLFDINSIDLSSITENQITISGNLIEYIGGDYYVDKRKYLKKFSLPQESNNKLFLGDDISEYYGSEDLFCININGELFFVDD